MRGWGYAASLLATSLGIQFATLKTWSDMTSPAFVASTILSVGAVLKALYSEPPGSPDAPA